MVTQDEIALIEQATLHKLAFVQALLHRKELAFSGTREIVRSRCLDYIDSGQLNTDELMALLESLDLWGNQRIRLFRIHDTDLQKFHDEKAVKDAIHKAGFNDIFQQELPLIVEEQVSPISIRYKEGQGFRTLTLIAGKILADWVAIDTLPELPYERVASLLDQADIPIKSIVYRPFKLQRRKIVSFAEINLETGHGLLSVKSTQSAGSYKTKYEEFYWAFDPLLRLSDAQILYLSKAISCIDNQENQANLDLPKQHLRDAQGGHIRIEASTGQGDIREHIILQQARRLITGDDSGDFCDCYWKPDEKLSEKVHASIYGSQGEIAFRGQASEESIRYVLQRIRDINN